MSFRSTALLGVVLGGCMSLAGCESLIDQRYRQSVLPNEGVQQLTGLGDAVSVRRNALGMPLIESHNFHDGLFAMGYVHAADRLSQMVTLRLLAQGRLAEMMGPEALGSDRFMRALNLKAEAHQLWQSASPRLQSFFEVYARGVNAYIYRYRNNLPMDLANTGVKLEYWSAEDSVLIFCLLNFGLSVNLQEELAALQLAEAVGADQLAWLLPTYPGEPLPASEAEKLKGIQLSALRADVAELSGALAKVAERAPVGVAASNSWAVMGSKTQSTLPLLANDMHLRMSLPSLWTFMHLRSPRYQAAGVSIAGVPSIVAGYNGQIGWGMTMVMGDNQDLFVEQTRMRNNRLEYLADGQWLPARARYETFLVKGQSAVREVVYETRHGPLLNGARSTAALAMPPSRYGLALQRPAWEGDKTLDAFFDISRARTVDQALEASHNVTAIALNMMFVDRENIAWQVTGRYPNRKAGVGLVPSPGWDGQYDWEGYADPMLFPYDINPVQGWLATANHRVTSAGYGMQLSNSWMPPERMERIEQKLSVGQQSLASTQQLQLDEHSLLAIKVGQMLSEPYMQQSLKTALGQLPVSDKAAGERVLAQLMRFDGNMRVDSTPAAMYSVFLQQSMEAIFVDELGGIGSSAWAALVQAGDLSYSAQADHLLARADSPFWDDKRTAQVEDKASILARSLVNTERWLTKQLGADSKQWRWGQLHTYYWQSGSSQWAPYLPASQRASVQSLRSYLDRGPYPAGGDQSTLNVSAYRWGESFDTWLIPSMRMIVDFGLNEPLLGVNSTGQSGNPASRHYADGIDAWRAGRYMTFPFKDENLSKAYGSKRLLLQPARR